MTYSNLRRGRSAALGPIQADKLGRFTEACRSSSEEVNLVQVLVSGRHKIVIATVPRG